MAHDFRDSVVYVSALDSANREAVLTAELICESFNLNNSGIRIAACQMRVDALKQEMSKLYKALVKYRENPKSKLNRKNIQVLLRREGAFAAFKRFYVKSHLKEYSGLEEFLL